MNLDRSQLRRRVAAPFVDALELQMLSALARLAGGPGRAVQVVRFSRGFVLVEPDVRDLDAARRAVQHQDLVDRWTAETVARSARVLICDFGDEWASEALSHATQAVVVRTSSLRQRQVWDVSRWWVDPRSGVREVLGDGFPEPLAANRRRFFDQDDPFELLPPAA